MTSRKGFKILYIAPAEALPGKVGGSVHVEEVSRGLVVLGHSVDILARRIVGRPEVENLYDNVRIHRLVPEYPLKSLLWLSKKYAYGLAKDIRPDYIIERYYNFGGAGILAGRRFGVPVMLEVNSPAVDHQGSLKAFLDRLMVFRPMRRYREFQCRSAADIIAPLPSILPPSVPAEKIHKVDWGAAVDRFRNKPSKREARKRLGIRQDASVIVFLGSFRKWHGIWDLAKAAEIIIRNYPNIAPVFLMIGDGPESAELQNWAQKKGFGEHFKFTGAVEYSEVPAHLAAADIGAAPFNPALHGQLKLGFYWSPLKVFEYMAASLPVVTIDVEPLNDIIRNGREGMLYPPGDAAACAEKIVKLLKLPATEREKLGRNAFERVSERYSWEKHCKDLDRIIRKRLNNK
jgi:starch synthase